MPEEESTAIQPAEQADALNTPVKQERPKTNVLAIIGFSLVFLAIAVTILSRYESGLLGLSMAASIAGLVCSIIGRVRCKKLGGSGKGFAIAGIVLNAVSLALIVFIIIAATLVALVFFAVFGWLFL